MLIRNLDSVLILLFFIILSLFATAQADELTLIVETDLAALGYDVGPVDGEETLDTMIAISKFQAENDLEVTGEVTPQLAGILAAKKSGEPDTAGPSAGEVEPVPAQDPAALQAAQQACLQEKMAAAQEANKKKRGFGRLMNAVVRTTTGQGNYAVAETANDIYNANATAEDLAAAAKDLGLTEDDVAACENPG